MGKTCRRIIAVALCLAMSLSGIGLMKPESAAKEMQPNRKTEVSGKRALDDIDAAIEHSINERVVDEKEYVDIDEESICEDTYERLLDKQTGIIKKTVYRPSEGPDMEEDENGENSTWIDCYNDIVYYYEEQKNIDGKQVDLYSYATAGLKSKSWTDMSFSWSARRNGEAEPIDDAVITVAGETHDCIVRRLSTKEVTDSGWPPDEWISEGHTGYVGQLAIVNSVDYYIGKSDGLIHMVVENKVGKMSRENKMTTVFVVSYPNETIERIPDFVTNYACLAGGEWYDSKGIRYESVMSYPLSSAGVKCILYDYSDTKKKAVIPDVIDFAGRWPVPVTSVNYGAFRNCSKLKKVVLGRNITKIAKRAFSKCPSLRTLNVKKVSDKNIQARLKNDVGYRKALGLSEKVRVITENPGNPVNVSLNHKKLTLKAGTKKRLKLKGAKGDVIYSSADMSIAYVTKDGTVTGDNAGTTTIYVTNNGNTCQCQVTVKPVSAGMNGRNELADYIRTKGEYNDKYEVYALKDCSWKDDGGVKHDIHIQYADEMKLLDSTSVGLDGGLTEYTDLALYFNTSGRATMEYELYVEDRDGRPVSVMRYLCTCPMTGVSPNGNNSWERAEISLLGEENLADLYSEDECHVLADKAMAGAYEAFDHVFREVMKTQFTMSYLGCTE